MMDDWIDWLIGLFMVVCVALLGFVIVFAVMDGVSTASGTVVDKYYDDEDLVCSKGCVITPECWTIVMDSEPWWNNTTCVSEEEYNQISIGDYHTE